MALSVAAGFATFLANMDLTPRQKEIADGRVAHLNAWFRANVACETYPEGIGSFGRGTLISRRRDIDVMSVLADDPYWFRYKDDSRVLMRWLRDKLNDAYGSTDVSTKQVAIRMLLGEGLQVDLVPMFTRPGGGYFMPNGAGGWRSTNPPFHAGLMSASNLRLDIRLKPLVRLMKMWNETNGRHLQSFHVEMLTEGMWQQEKAVAPYPDALSTAFLRASIWLGYPTYDPWKGAGEVRIDTYLSADERAVVIRLLEADYKNAGIALAYDRAGATKAAFERWGVIFGGAFPAYG